MRRVTQWLFGLLLSVGAFSAISSPYCPTETHELAWGASIHGVAPLLGRSTKIDFAACDPAILKASPQPELLPCATRTIERVLDDGQHYRVTLAFENLSGLTEVRLEPVATGLAAQSTTRALAARIAQRIIAERGPPRESWDLPAIDPANTKPVIGYARWGRGGHALELTVQSEYIHQTKPVVILRNDRHKLRLLNAFLDEDLVRPPVALVTAIPGILNESRLSKRDCDVPKVLPTHKSGSIQVANSVDAGGPSWSVLRRSDARVARARQSRWQDPPIQFGGAPSP